MRKLLFLTAAALLAAVGIASASGFLSLFAEGGTRSAGLIALGLVAVFFFTVAARSLRSGDWRRANHR